jgi:hypothetical protein
MDAPLAKESGPNARPAVHLKSLLPASAPAQSASRSYHWNLAPNCVVLAALPEFRVERIPVVAIDVGSFG